MRTEDYACRYRQTGYRLRTDAFGYKIDYSSNGGYYVSAEDIANGPKVSLSATARPGDFKYVDENKDGKILTRKTRCLSSGREYLRSLTA
jgi:hypothetical protein